MKKMRKYIHILAGLLCIPAILCSCSSSVKGNGDVCIGFEQAEYSFKESAGLTKIRIAVTGRPASNPVKFDIEAKVTSDEGLAVNDIIHFTQSKGLKVSDRNVAPVYVEFTVKDNDYINESRFIELSITNVTGAAVSQGTATVEIRDNDNDPYDKLMGDWTATALDYTGAKTTFPVNISGGFTPTDVTSNEGRVLVCWGFGPYQREFTDAVPPRQPVWYMDFDEDAKKLSVQPNVLMANVFEFTDLGYDVIIRCCTIEPGPAISMTLPLEGTWSDDMDTITFQGGGYGLTAAIFNT
ncbi:MAG: hypothetical protein NC308_06905, partial [Clostridium sp.]|nr:hypothetical protein [Clostridium sp.]